MNKNPVVESEKTIHDLRKDLKEKTEWLRECRIKVVYHVKEIQKLRSLLQSLLFQYDASNLPEWDEVRAVREYFKENE